MSDFIIDAHNHPSWLGMTTDKVVENMDACGISRSVIMSWELPESEYFAVDDYRFTDPRYRAVPLKLVTDAVEKYPGRFIPGWAPDPRDRYARAKLKAAVEMFDLKIYGELKCMIRYDQPNAIAMYHFCAELGLPVLFHLECIAFTMREFTKDMASWPVWYGGDMAVVDNMCRLCPQTTFIGHGPGLWAEISANADQADNIYPGGPVEPGGRLIQMMDKHPNLYLDISAGSGRNALDRDRAHAVEFLTRYQDRVLFGRDCFDNQHLELLMSLSLDKTVLNKILSGNASRVLKLI